MIKRPPCYPVAVGGWIPRCFSHSDIYLHIDSTRRKRVVMDFNVVFKRWSYIPLHKAFSILLLRDREKDSLMFLAFVSTAGKPKRVPVSEGDV